MTATEVTIRNVFFVFIAATLYSCVSYKPLPQDNTTNSLSSSIKTGDMLKLVLKNGDKINYVKVISVDGEYLVGTRLLLQHHRWRQESVTIKISDTQTIKKRKFSAGKTIALSVGLIPAGLLIYLLIYPPVFRITF